MATIAMRSPSHMEKPHKGVIVSNPSWAPWKKPVSAANPIGSPLGHSAQKTNQLLMAALWQTLSEKCWAEPKQPTEQWTVFLITPFWGWFDTKLQITRTCVMLFSWDRISSYNMKLPWVTGAQCHSKLQYHLEAHYKCRIQPHVKFMKPESAF